METNIYTNQSFHAQ